MSTILLISLAIILLPVVLYVLVLLIPTPNKPMGLPKFYTILYAISIGLTLFGLFIPAAFAAFFGLMTQLGVE